MIQKAISHAANALLLGSLFLACPLAATAQRNGGDGIASGGLSGISRPSGVKEDESLKDFHEAMALQATSQQTGDFQALVKSTEAAQAEVRAVLEKLRNQNAAAEPLHRDSLDQAVENARNGTRKFQQGLSPAQRSGLKEIARRLAKADAELEQEEKRLDQMIDLKASGPEFVSRAQSLDKALTEFSQQQLALGREMSITLASGQDLAFTLPAMIHPVNIANRTIAIPVSGALDQIAAQAGRRTFKIVLTADLTDLQQNITEVLRAQLDSSAGCGERVAIQRATLAPSTPASLLVLKLHFERWSCSQTFGQQASNELAEGDGTVEIKLTASVQKSDTGASSVKIVAAFGRIDASGMLAESLRSGSLGEDLRTKVAQSVLPAAQISSDFKLTLPPALQNSALIQTARFQDEGVGTLTVVLNGQIEISNEQADQLASQLNQALAAQGINAR